MVEHWPSKPVMRVRSPSLAPPGPANSLPARGRARIRLAQDGGGLCLSAIGSRTEIRLANSRATGIEDKGPTCERGTPSDAEHRSAPVAQGIEQRPSKPWAGGSIPPGRASMGSVAQWLAHWVVVPGVAGSSPVAPPREAARSLWPEARGASRTGERTGVREANSQAMKRRARIWRSQTHYASVQPQEQRRRACARSSTG